MLTFPRPVAMLPTPMPIHSALPDAFHRAFQDPRLLAISTRLGKQYDLHPMHGSITVTVETDGVITTLSALEDILAFANPHLLETIVGLHIAWTSTLPVHTLFEVWDRFIARSASDTNLHPELVFTKHGCAMRADPRASAGYAFYQGFFQAALDKEGDEGFERKVCAWLDKRPNSVTGILLRDEPPTAHARLHAVEHERNLVALWERLVIHGTDLTFRFALTPTLYANP